MLQEGRAASGGRREVFTPGSVEWPAAGVVVRTEHRGKAETRGLVVRQSDGRLTITARATRPILRRVGILMGRSRASVERLRACGLCYLCGQRPAWKPEKKCTECRKKSRIKNRLEADAKNAELREYTAHEKGEASRVPAHTQTAALL